MNPELDQRWRKLVKQTAVETDPARLAQLYAEIDRLATEQEKKDQQAKERRETAD